MYQKCSAPRFRAPRPDLPSPSLIHREDARSCHPGSSRLPLSLLRRLTSGKAKPDLVSTHVHSRKAKCLSFHGVWSLVSRNRRLAASKPFPTWRRDVTCSCIIIII